jgi:hypothetical protein
MTALLFSCLLQSTFMFASFITFAHFTVFCSHVSAARAVRDKVVTVAALAAIWRK